MKKLALAIPFLIILFAASGGFWFYVNSQPVSGNKNFSFFVINKGASASQIANKLKSGGFIKNALALKIYLQLTGQAGKLQTGEFRLTPSYSLFQTVKTLFNGPVELWVTIPEGLRREEIASKFATGLMRDSSFLNEFMLASKGKEGYLFPDTYLFPPAASASAIVAKMSSTFSSKTQNLTPTGSGLTFSQSVILASIIERETKTDAERPVVAGILINRLNAGIPLQVDAAVQYAVANAKCQILNAKCDWWPVLTLDDLDINSPYNTYKHAGLPPTPIASPGYSSLKAAFAPEASDYFYYIHDPQGKIHYAKTLSEHNANVSKYLR